MNLERLKLGKDIKGDCGSDPTKMPPWMDKERFKRGQEFFHRHSAAAAFALHCSMTVGFGVGRIVRVVSHTKRSDTPAKALHRYLKTYLHVSLWHTGDVWDPSTEAHHSTQIVRAMHRNTGIAMNAEIQPVGEKFVSQYDMGLVQSGFMAVLVMYPSEFGVSCTREELEDYVFFWRGIGYLLGIQDEYNVASGGLDEVCKLCKEIEHEVIYLGLQDPPPNYESMANAYVGGLSRMKKTFNDTKESILKLAFDVMGYPLLPSISLTWGDHLRVMWFKTILFMMRWMPGFEQLCNFVPKTVYKQYRYLIDKELLKAIN